jgi:hypothetical protein
MPWWVTLYFALFGLLALAGIWDDYSNRRPVLFLCCVIFSNLVIVFLFAAFWYPLLSNSLGFAAPMVFLGSMGWEMCEAVKDIRALRSDPEISESQQRFVATVTAVAIPVICLPAFIVSGIAAFRV